MWQNSFEIMLVGLTSSYMYHTKPPHLALKSDTIIITCGISFAKNIWNAIFFNYLFESICIVAHWIEASNRATLIDNPIFGARYDKYHLNDTSRLSLCTLSNTYQLKTLFWKQMCCIFIIHLFAVLDSNICEHAELQLDYVHPVILYRFDCY